MNRTTTIAAILLTAFALCATALWIACDARPRPASAQPTPATSSAPASAPIAVAPRFNLGARRAYRLETSLDIVLRPPNVSQGAEMLSIGFSGMLTMTVIRAASPIEIEGVITGVNPWAGKPHDSTMDPAARRAVADSLEAPFYVRVDARGAITSMRFRRGLDPIARGMVKSVLSVATFVDPPAGRAAGTWTADESDPTGEYVASYRTLDGYLVFEKTRSSYRRVSNGAALVPVEQAGVFETTLQSRFELDNARWPRSVQSLERLRVDPGQGAPIVTSICKTTLLLTSTGVDAAASLPRETAEYETVSMVTLQKTETLQQRRDKQLLGNASFALLKDKLNKLHGERDSGAARAAIQGQMEALFRLHPDTAYDALTRLDEGDGADTKSTVLAALSEAGTPQSQAALLDQAGPETEDAEVRVHAVASLGLTHNPTDDTLRTLEEMTTDASNSDEVRATAALALGNAARQLAGNDRSDEASNVIDRLLSLFENARTPQEQALALQALGNTGDPRVLPAIATALGSHHDIVRGAAALALRFVAAPTVDPIIASLLKGDPAATVRRSAIFAAAFRSLDALIPVLREVVRADADPGVRLDAVNALGGVLANHPELAEPLRWSAEHDPSPDVRRAASGYVHP